jgi:RNA polymerase sigma factor (sigma-70 family)
MEPCTAKPYCLVPIQGRDYLWTPEQGLDPEAIQTVDLWIWRGANRLRQVAARCGLSVDDLAQEGRLGALRAARDYDPARGAKFLTYAYYWIRHYMLSALQTGDVSIPERSRDALRLSGGMPVVLSLDTPLPGWEQDLAALLPGDPDPEPDQVLDRTKARLREALGRLKAREREVLVRRFYRGETLDAIGLSWSLTRQRVAQIERRALLRLRLLLGQEGAKA